MKKIKNKIGFKLFYNDKFVIFFSVLVAFIAWVMVASSSEESTVFTVTDIPLSLPPLSNELQYFGGEDITAEVKISGNALIVPNVSKNDIVITTEDTAGITKPGIYSVNLIPKKKGVKSDYTFASTVSPSSVEIFVDFQREKTMVIDDMTDIRPASGYSIYTKVLSIQNVKLSGPASIVDSVEKVEARFDKNQALSESQTVRANLVFLNAAGESVTSEFLKSDITYVDIPVTVVRMSQAKIEPVVTDVPDHLGDSYKSYMTVTPSSATVGLSANSAAGVLELAEIDFSTVSKANNTFKRDILFPADWKNLDNTDEATVTFNLDDMEEYTFRVTEFVFQGLDNVKQAKVAGGGLEVTLIGPRATIEALRQRREAAAKLPLSNMPTPFTAIVAVTASRDSLYADNCSVSFNMKKDYNDCWVEGTHLVNVQITEKKTAQTEASAAQS